MRFGLEEHIITELNEVFEANSKVDKAIVFGSRAKGNYRPDSDIDIAIKGANIILDDILKMQVALDEKGINLKVDLVHYDTLREKALTEHIDRVGIQMFSRWKQFKFKDLLVDESISYGVVQPGFHDNKGVPIIRVNNIKNGTIITDDILKIDSDIESKYKRTKLLGGELLITLVGSVGECAIVPQELKGWNVARAVGVARIKNDFDKRFIKYAFQSEDVKHQLYGNTNDTVQPTLNLSSLKEIILELPPLSEQTAIADILDALDNKINLLHRQNKTLEQLAETLFRKWFVEGVSEDWKPQPLGKFVEIKRGGSPRPIHDFISETGLNWLKISDVTSVDSPFIFEIKEKIKEEGLSKTTYLKKGSLVLSNSATPGIPKILDVDSCIHDGWLHFPKSKFSNEFLYLFFKHIRPELLQLGNGSIFTNLKTDILKEYVLAIPDDKSLALFDQHIKTIFEKLYVNTTQIRTLIKLRDTLLPNLMSGGIRIDLEYSRLRKPVKGKKANVRQ